MEVQHSLDGAMAQSQWGLERMDQTCGASIAAFGCTCIAGSPTRDVHPLIPAQMDDPRRFHRMAHYPPNAGAAHRWCRHFVQLADVQSVHFIQAVIITKRKGGKHEHSNAHCRIKTSPHRAW